MKIRLSQTDSINSINKDNITQIELSATKKDMPFLNIVGEVDSYQVFENERNNCTNYRLIITINPYCTNVLFNTLTEIIKNEGSPDVSVIRDNNNIEDKDGNVSGVISITNVYGEKNPTRSHMIMNTEYSRNNIGYTYLPGYDIFNNHIMRNKTFKIVNKYKDENDETRRIFNTIKDYLRSMDGSITKTGKRKNINEMPEFIDKHLYLYDDVMSLEESINSNLVEENGWLGFINKNCVPSKKQREENAIDINGYTIYDDLGISKILNNYENCEFIDMYPDRSLFSFNPKLNKFRKRLEYNWNIVLTYPYRNEYCNKLVTSDDGKTNGLLMMSIIKTLNSSGSNTLLFRSYCKHGLIKGDTINVYINGESLPRSIKVTDVGNLSSDNDDNALYYFYTTDMTLLNYIDISLDTESGKWVDNRENKTLYTNDVNEKIRERIDECRIRRLVNGIESEYYIRVFRKLPNLKNKQENLTKEIAEDREKFENYIYGTNGSKMNAAKVSDEDNETYMLDFNNEQYRLAFNRTIYNDASTQITYTDTINIEYLVDNLGRPLHEIYATIIKANQGYKEWYGISYEGYKYDYNEGNIKINDEKVEYSHCFGNVSSGVEFFHTRDDRNDERMNEECAKLGDISLLNELKVYNAMPLETEITSKGRKIYEYSSQDKHQTIDEFYGDIVEFSPMECNEHILQQICHRFNTMQREMPSNNIFNKFIHDEIEYDDLDKEDFNVKNIDEVDEANQEHILYDKIHTCSCIQRPEGYFYQAHYSIPIKEFGNLEQSAHYDIKVKTAQPTQMDGIYIKITTPLKQTISTNDIIYVCFDDEENYRNDKWYEFSVPYVEDNRNFYIHPYNVSWKELTDKINNDLGISYNWVTLAMAFTAENIAGNDGSVTEYKNVKLRRRNEDIPKYASKIAHNKYLWRDLYRPGEFLDGQLEELSYTNNAFYISKEINFFLKRQDPYGYIGLYCKDVFPSDVKGKQRQEDTYYYKDESEIAC